MFERHDHRYSPSRLGFRRGHSCAKFVTIVDRLLKNRGEWGLRTSKLQAASSRAHDAIRHVSILGVLQERQVPQPLATAYSREGRGALMAFSQEGGQADPVKTGSGLRQGCSTVPMALRWILQACPEPLHDRWCTASMGISIDHDAITQLACEPPADLNSALADLSAHAEKTTGPEIRLEKCKQAAGDPTDSRGRHRRCPDDAIAGESLEGSHSFRSNHAHHYLVLCSLGHDQAKMLVGFSQPRRFWEVRGKAKEQVRMLHTSVFPVLDWVAGGRDWIRQELTAVHSIWQSATIVAFLQ